MYILVESFMNGTVTISTHVTIVKTDVFYEAVNKIKAVLPKNSEITIDNNEEFAYYIGHQQYPCMGILKNEVPSVI